MKWILSNKTLFDTQTATLIASWSNGLHYRETNFVEETLYRSKSGGFFLIGNRIDGASTGDSPTDRCRQLTPEETLQWCMLRQQEQAAADHLRETLNIA